MDDDDFVKTFINSLWVISNTKISERFKSFFSNTKLL